MITLNTNQHDSIMLTISKVISNVKNLFSKHNNVSNYEHGDYVSIDYADLLTNGSIPRIKYQLSKLHDPVLIVNDCDYDDIHEIMRTLDNASISSMARVIINYDKK